LGRFTCAILLFTVAVGSATPAVADLYECKRGEKIWYTNHRLSQDNNCRLIVKDFATPQTAPTTAGKAAGDLPAAPKRKARKWKPPRKVTFKDNSKAQADKLTDIHQIVGQASARYDIPEAFIHAVITVESSYKVRALSYKGAMGLMQLMPGTAADMGVTDPYNPFQNVMGATRFLRLLANRFDGDIPKVLAAFHAGGGAVARADGIPFQGSDGYVRKVLNNYYRLKRELQTAASSPLQSP
jgi:soluble lytic murein transglycosylase-like protein